jgi:hypothetical protein
MCLQQHRIVVQHQMQGFVLLVLPGAAAAAEAGKG